MRNIQKILMLFTIIFICGFVLFLSTWKIPAPTVEVEIVIPNDRFPK